MATTTMQRLRCKLTPRERTAKTDELRRTMAELDDLKADKAAAMKRFATLIGDAEKKISDLAFDVRDSSELRPIECYERPRFDIRLVDVVRGDLDEVVSTRPMTATELQTAFADVPSGAKSSGKNGQHDSAPTS